MKGCGGRVRPGRGRHADEMRGNSARLRLRSNLAVFLGLVSYGCASSRLADPSRFPSFWSGDADCVAAARARGDHVRRGDVHVWVSPGADWAESFAAEVRTGVDAVRGVLTAWGLESPTHVEVYACDRKIVSHAPGGPFVFLARAAIEEKRAPWLHEVTHVLLRGGPRDWMIDFDEETASRTMPLWLTEGLTEFVAQTTSETARVASSGPFSTPVARLDETCVSAASDGPASMLRWVGRAGRAPELFGSDRFRHARVFYPCATSFIAWLAAGHGLRPLLDAQRATPREQERWEEIAGTSLESERALWLCHLSSLPGGGQIPLD